MQCCWAKGPVGTPGLPPRRPRSTRHMCGLIGVSRASAGTAKEVLEWVSSQKGFPQCSQAGTHFTSGTHLP